MNTQTGSWFRQIWRKLALIFRSRSSHLQLTRPALYSVPRAIHEPSTRTISAIQWQLNDHPSRTTDHFHGIREVEVELITDPHEKLPVHFSAGDANDLNIFITHSPSDRLH